MTIVFKPNILELKPFPSTISINNFKHYFNFGQNKIRYIYGEIKNVKCIKEKML